MSDLNQCNFIGRLGQPPETKYLPNGTALANFSIACGEKYTDKSGQKVEKTEWIRCTAFAKLAEIVEKYLKKGSQVYISGKMVTRSWEKDGAKHYATGITVTTLQLLGSRQNDSTQPERQDGDVPF